MAGGLCGCLVAGCHLNPAIAPVHVWSPPRLQSAVGRQVAIAPIVGDPKIAGPLHAAMLAHAPRDGGRQLVCVDAKRFLGDQTIQLASAIEGQSSDIAMLSLARRSGVDYLLSGEIVEQPSQARLAMHKASQHSGDGRYTSRNQAGETGETQLTVSWKLVDVTGDQPSVGFPVVTSAIGKSDTTMVAQAAADDAWKLIVPSVRQQSVTLATPRFTTGSHAVRKANELATDGQWMFAEESWRRVLVSHPKQHAALHNLAIAAVAKQEFDKANRLIGEALRLRQAPLYRETAVWIESCQRDYHKAFGLGDPIAGWSATRR